jgi:hypothetical protein
MSPLQDKFPVGIEAVIDNIDSPRQPARSGRRPDESLAARQPVRVRPVAVTLCHCCVRARPRARRTSLAAGDTPTCRLRAELSCRCRTGLLTGRFG